MEGEDVDEEAFLVGDVEGVACFDVEGVEVADLDDGLLGGGVGVGGLQEEVWGELGGADGAESLEVAVGHGDVDVVVPGYEALVSYGSEEGASVEPVLYVVLVADAVYLLEYAELLELAGAEILLGVVLHRVLSLAWGLSCAA